MTIPFDFDPPKPPPPPPPAAPPKKEPRVFGVGELARAIRDALGKVFGTLWVEGEITGLRAAGSGHVYFTLKDEEEDASLDCAMYRASITARARALMKDGARVRLLGAPQFWPPRGKLQFVAERVAPAGKGALLEALEKLKEKLAAEGLFAEGKKRTIPSEPRIVGVVTSREGAVIHDIRKVAHRRGGASILLADAVVQGPNAPSSIVHALDIVSRVKGVDVVIVGRGGGSADDLAAFNDESVVRAVARCRVPVVSAVGHEVDVTLTDFAADARAATPSQAAEMVVPDRVQRHALLAQMRGRLARCAHARLAHEKGDFARIMRRMSDPRLTLFAHQQTLDDRNARLDAIGHRLTKTRREKLVSLSQRLARRHPGQVLAVRRHEIERASERIRSLVTTRLAKRRSTVQSLAGQLDAMSPLKVLARGYAVATDEKGHAIVDANAVKPGDEVVVRVHTGAFRAKVEPSK
ncbi:MAG TPA: exodeoxyribonuclease VII large subunit [Polyangiaceae bacterium]